MVQIENLKSESTTQPAFNVIKVDNGNNRKRCEIYNWCHSGVFIVNFERISHCFVASIVDFEKQMPAGLYSKNNNIHHFRIFSWWKLLTKQIQTEDA